MRKLSHSVIQKVNVCFVADHRVQVSIQKILGHHHRRLIILQIQLCAAAGFPDLLDHCVHILLIRALVHAETVTGHLFDRLCRIAVLHCHRDRLNLRFRPGDLVQRLQNMPDINNAEQQHTAHKDCENAAC